MNNDTTTPSQTGTAQSLKSEAVALKDKAADRLASEADSRKGDVAGGMKQVSSALDAATSQLEGGEAPDWLKQGFAKVASSVNSFATELENTDSSDLAAKVQGFARRSPGAFLSACGAAGFAAARVFMAGQSSGSGSASRSAQTFGGSGGTMGATGSSMGSTGSTGGSMAGGRPYGQDASYGAGSTGGTGNVVGTHGASGTSGSAAGGAGSTGTASGLGMDRTS